MKHFFYKWISVLSSEEKKQFKKHSKLLNEKHEKFVTAVLKRVSDWQSSHQNDTEEFEEIITKSKQKEGKNHLSTFTKGINHLKSFLIDFLVVIQTRKDKTLTQKVLFKNAQNRNFPEGYFHHLEQWERNVKIHSNESFDFAYDMFRVNYHRFFHPDFSKFKLKTHNNNQDYIPEEVLANSWQYLELFRLIAQTRLACEIEYNKWIIGENKVILEELTELDVNAVRDKLKDYNALKVELLQLQKIRTEQKDTTTLKTEEEQQQKLIQKFEEKLKGHITLNIYFNIYQWLKEKDFYDLSKLQSIIDITIENIRFFSVEEQYSLLMMLNNCVGRTMRYSNKNEELKRMLADITVIGFQHDIFGKEVDMNINFFSGLYDIVRFVYPDFAVSMKNEHIQKLPTKNDEKWGLTFINVRELMQKEAYYDAILDLKQLEHHNNYGLTMRKFVLLLQCTYDLHIVVLKDSTLQNLKAEDFSDLESWMKIIENISKTFSTSNYLTKVSASDRLTFFNFVAVASIFYLKTHSIHEIKTIIDNNPTFSIPWLNNELVTYSKDLASDLDNRLKTYHKILNLLSLDDFSTKITEQ